MANKTIVALYDEFDDAVKAVRALENGGFQHEDTSLIANNVADRHSSHVTAGGRGHDTEAAEGAGTGATIGAVLGGGAGLLAGLGMLAIPGVGPVVAAGPLVALITGAGVGAAAGGILGGLVGMGVPEHEAHYYAEGVRRGGALVTASVPEDQVQRAVDILERYDPADVEQRGAAWRDGGWTGFDHGAQPLDRDRVESERNLARGNAGPGAPGGSAGTMGASGMGASGMAGTSPAPTSGMAGTTAVRGASGINQGAGAYPGSTGTAGSSSSDRPSPADRATSTDATGIVGLPGSGRQAAPSGTTGRRARSYAIPPAEERGQAALDRAAAGNKPTLDDPAKKG
jgi:hypothetical protein